MNYSFFLNIRKLQLLILNESNSKQIIQKYLKRRKIRVRFYLRHFRISHGRILKRSISMTTSDLIPDQSSAACLTPILNIWIKLKLGVAITIDEQQELRIDSAFWEKKGHFIWRTHNELVLLWVRKFVVNRTKFTQVIWKCQMSTSLAYLAWWRSFLPLSPKRSKTVSTTDIKLCNF